LTYKIAVLPNGGHLTTSGGSLEWVDNATIETYKSKDDFEERLDELSTY